MQMKKRLSAILLACGLSVSMLGGTAFAASATASTETALEQAATEAEAVESELAKDTGETQQETTAVAQPSEVTGDRKYEQLYNWRRFRHFLMTRSHSSRIPAMSQPHV